MKTKLKLIIPIIFITNIFAINYQDAITEPIRSIFHFKKIDKVPKKIVQKVYFPATIEGGTYSSGDNKLIFNSVCFETESDSKIFFNGFIKNFDMSEDKFEPDLYATIFPHGIILIKRAKNCFVDILYFGDPSNGFLEGKAAFINSEITYLRKFNQ